MLTFLLVTVFGDFGIPVFHRFGWCYRPEASSLNRVRNARHFLGRAGCRAEPAETRQRAFEIHQRYRNSRK